jgi:hypothetical protein
MPCQTLPCIAEQRPTHDVQVSQVQRPTCLRQEAEYEWLVPAKGLPASLTELRLLHWPRIKAQNDMSGGRLGLHQDRKQHCHLAQLGSASMQQQRDGMHDTAATATRSRLSA